MNKHIELKWFASGIFLGATIIALLVSNTTGNTETIYARPTVTMSVFHDNLFLWKLVCTNSGSVSLGSNNLINIEWKWNNYEKRK